MQGLIDGLVAGTPGLIKTLKGLTDDMQAKVVEGVASTFDDAIAAIEAKRDGIKSALDGIKGEFTSLRDSIAQTFAGDLFNVSAIAESVGETTTTAAQTVGQVFSDTLRDKKTQLTELLGAFKTLKGFGIPAQFLSQLFASGNSALILELASGSKGQAASQVSLFKDVQSLSDKLGGQVASNQYGPQIDRLDKSLGKVADNTKALKSLARDIARELNGAVKQGERKAA